MGSKRIQALINLIDPSTEVLWDLCCDHGKIGLAALEKYPHLKIHFVDQVPSIMDRLKKNLGTDIPSKTINFHISDIRKLSFPPGATIIAAGVGGLLLIEFLEAILPANIPNLQIILGAHQNIHDLRWYLNEKNLAIKTEVLVRESNKFYELLALEDRTYPSPDANLIGRSMWDLTSLDHREYISKNIEYYTLRTKFSNDFKAEVLLKEFKQLINKF